MAYKLAAKYRTRRDRAARNRLALGGTALYVRVSTDKQAGEGYSLAEQRARLTAYCTAQGWPLDPSRIYADGGESGTTTERPAFQAMLAAARGGDVRRIVAVKLDRLARNVRDFLALVDDLQAWGCDLVLLKESFDTGTPQGKFALTLFAAMAELEASTITERVMAGKAQKATLGGYNGGPAPLGYDYDGAGFTPNADAATVRAIFARFLAGDGLTALARDLNAAGAATAHGGRWYASTVRYILSNGLYAGRSQWDGTDAPAAHHALIDDAAYQAALRRLADLRRGARRGRSAASPGALHGGGRP